MEFLVVLICAIACWRFLGWSLIGLAGIASFLAFLSLGVDPTTPNAGIQDLSTLGNSSSSVFKIASRFIGSSLLLALFALRAQWHTDLFRWPSFLGVGFFLVALFSIYNSANPSLSFLRIFEWGCFFLGAIAIHNCVTRIGGPVELVRFLALSTLPLSAGVLLLALLSPETAIEIVPHNPSLPARLGGVVLDPNTVAYLGCLSSIFGITAWRCNLFGAARTGRLASLALLGLGGALILLSFSRTGYLSSLVIFLFLAFRWARQSGFRSFSFCFFSILALMVSPLFFESIINWATRGADIADLWTATGRTVLWAGLLAEEFPKHPLLGHGYMMLGDSGPFLQNGVPWNNAHNSLIFALISTGLFGLIAVFGMIFVAVRGIAQKLSPGKARGRVTSAAHEGLFAALVATLIEATSGYGMIGHPSPSMLLFLILFTAAYLGD